MSIFDQHSFEQEIVRVARQVFHPIIEEFVPANINDQERDAIFVTEDNVHCIECTVSQQVNNTRHNLDKLEELVRLMRRRYPDKLCAGWYITLNPLKDAQAEIIRQYPKYIKHRTYKDFLARLVDSHEYLVRREVYRFGSVQNPKTNSYSLDRKYFVPTRFHRRRHTANLSSGTKFPNG